MPAVVNYSHLSKVLPTNEAAAADSLKDILAKQSTVAPSEGVLGEEDPPPTEEELDLLAAQIARAMETLRDESQGRSGVITSVEAEFASALQTFISEKCEEEGKVNPAILGGNEAKFDEKDWLGWAGSFFRMWRKHFPHKWVAPPAVPFEMHQDSFRIALTGDWGTGLYGAPLCAQSIEKDGKFDVLIHLGDIYYTGSDKETDLFLNLWPKVPGAISRACNSNHEMYSGGKPYFKKTLVTFNQSSSCFALQNKHWLLIGLDTAYKDHDLAENQEQWVEQLINNAPGKNVVLFGHHQPFSQIDGQGMKLAEKLRGLLESGRIFAWYFGHEHRCVIYDRHPKWNLYGRCIGHSGYPYFRKKVAEYPEAEKGEVGMIWRKMPGRTKSEIETPPSIVLDGPNDYLGDEREKYGPNGYATLRFEPDRIVEQIYLPHGSPVWKQERELKIKG